MSPKKRPITIYLDPEVWTALDAKLQELGINKQEWGRRSAAATLETTEEHHRLAEWAQIRARNELDPSVAKRLQSYSPEKLAAIERTTDGDGAAEISVEAAIDNGLVPREQAIAALERLVRRAGQKGPILDASRQEEPFRLHFAEQVLDEEIALDAASSRHQPVRIPLEDFGG